MGLISYALDQNHREEVRHTYNYDEAEDRVIISREQDIGRIVSGNREMRNKNDGYTKDRTMKRVGRIPNVVIEKIMIEEKWDPLAPENAERLLQLLDDPEYSKFKTSEGRVAHKARRHFFRGSVSTKPVFGGDE